MGVNIMAINLSQGDELFKTLDTQSFPTIRLYNDDKGQKYFQFNLAPTVDNLMLLMKEFKIKNAK